MIAVSYGLLLTNDRQLVPRLRYLIDGESEAELVVVVVAVAHRHQGLVVAVVDLVDRLKRRFPI